MDHYEPNLNYWEPHKTPVFLANLFIFWKEFARERGYLDVDTDIFAGDDTEFSLKTWMCGGSIEYIPCSNIFHMFKQHKFSHRDIAPLYVEDRLAETWLDDNYKKYYYRIKGDSKDRIYGDISRNLYYKKKANCKSFTWYVENVLGGIEIPEKVRDENWGKKNLTGEGLNEGNKTVSGR